MYKFNKQNDLNNKKLNIKLLLKFLIKTFRKRSSVKLIKAFIIEILNLLREIKSVYEYNNIILNIIQINILNDRESFFRNY